MMEEKEELLPPWLTELSLEVRESFDSNVYLQKVTEQANQGSLITTIHPTIGIKVKDLFLDSSGDDLNNAFTFKYSPSVNIYHAEPSEDHTLHKVNTAFGGKNDEWTWKIANMFLYTDGSMEAPIYTGPGTPAIAHFQVRDRREAIQNRGNVMVRYDIDDEWFIRPKASTVLYDFMAHQRQGLAGYQNYVDRYGVQGGADVGYKFIPNTYFTVGYQFGHQQQSRLSWIATDADNTFHQVLFGIEGKPWDWLKVNIVGGPDFRFYENQIAAGFDQSPTKSFVKAVLTATITEDDTLTFKTHRLTWLSSAGRVPYEDIKYTLIYKHNFEDVVTLSALAQAYNGDTDQPWFSEDYIYTLGTGLVWHIDDYWSAMVDYSFDHAETENNNGAFPGREYQRHIISVGGKVEL